MSSAEEGSRVDKKRTIFSHRKQGEIAELLKKRRMPLQARTEKSSSCGINVRSGPTDWQGQSHGRIEMMRMPVQHMERHACSHLASTPRAELLSPEEAEENSSASSRQDLLSDDDSRRSDNDGLSMSEEDKEDSSTDNDFPTNYTPPRSDCDGDFADDVLSSSTANDDVGSPGDDGDVEVVDKLSASQTRRHEADPQDISTWKKMPCRLALKAAGVAGVSRLHLKRGSAGLEQIQSLCRDYWEEASVSMSAAVAKYNSGAPSKDMHQVKKEKTSRLWGNTAMSNGARASKKAKSDGIPQGVKDKVLMLIQIENGVEAVEARGSVSFSGETYQVRDVIEAMSESESADVGTAKGKGKGKEKVTKKAPAEISARNVVRGKNACFRILNCLFHDSCRNYWKASELALKRDQPDNGEKDAKLLFWQLLLKNVMDRKFDAGGLLPSKDWADTFDGYDPNVVDIPSSTSAKDIKRWYESLRQAYNAITRNFEKSGTHDKDFSNFCGSRADILYLWLWLERCPDMEIFCSSLLDKEIAQDCVGQESDAAKSSFPPVKTRKKKNSHTKALEGISASAEAMRETVKAVFMGSGGSKCPSQSKGTALLEGLDFQIALVEKYNTLRKQRAELNNEEPESFMIGVIDKEIEKIRSQVEG